MNLLILFIRIAITATFLILAAGGPYAVILLRRFIRRYKTAHDALENRVLVLEQWRKIQEETHSHD